MKTKTVNELRRMANDLGVKGIGKLNKGELFVAIQEANRKAAVESSEQGSEAIPPSLIAAKEAWDEMTSCGVEGEPDIPDEPEVIVVPEAGEGPNSLMLQFAMDIMSVRLAENANRFPAFSDLDTGELQRKATYNLESIEAYLMNMDTEKAIQQAGDGINYMVVYLMRVLGDG